MDTGKKHLGLMSKTEKFNFELDDNDEIARLPGNRTIAIFRKVLGDRWDSYSAAQQTSLVESVLSFTAKDALYRHLKRAWQLEPRECYAIATAPFEAGYASLSRRAIRRILPHLQNGIAFADACTIAGYNHSKPQQQEPLPLVPEVGHHVRNPIVQRVLAQTRVVVNAVIRRYGKPDAIRIELARNLRRSKRERERLQKENRAREGQRKQAREKLRELGLSAFSEANILKYRLWEECKGICPYTGRCIQCTKEDLFSEAVEIEASARRAGTQGREGSAGCLLGSSRD